MYSVLVVDDETIVRLAVRKIISNADCEFQVVGEGENGKQALKCCEDYGDIDIILTDITMPILNGLELTRELMKKENPPIVVAISSYNDYDLVREAFKLGAKDYILKSNLNEETLLNLLNKLVEKERITRQRQDRSLKYEKEMLLKSWLDGQKADDYQEPFKELKIKLNAEDITVCSVLIDDFQEVKERHGLWDRANLDTLMQDTLSQLLDGNRQGEGLVLSDNKYLLLLSIDESGSQAYIDSVGSLVKQFKYNLNHYANIKVTIGVSSRGTVRQLSGLYAEAEQNANLRFILGKNRIIYSWTRNQINCGQAEADGGEISGLIEALEMTSESEVEKELPQVLERLSRAPAALGKIYFNYMELIFHINKFIYDSGYSVEEVYGKDFDFYEKIQNFETTEEINIWIGNMIRWILNFFKEHRKAGTRSQIERAQEFIKKNYDKDLPLKVVSEYVSLSENYFSAQFLKYTGINFTEYVSGIRIEKAKKYLKTTDLKMYEICNKIGYANVEHFSRVFKKHTGLSPLKFRNENKVRRNPQ